MFDPFNKIFDREYRLYSINNKYKYHEYRRIKTFFCPVCCLYFKYLSLDLHKTTKRHQKRLIKWHQKS